MPDYQLDALGWFQFERLCQSLLHADHGVDIELWGGTGDFGRDAYAEGPLEFPAKGHSRQGPFIFQAKYVQGANAAGARPATALLTAVRSEAARIRKRRDEGGWDDPGVYVLMTNAPISPRTRRELAAALAEAVPAAEAVILQGAADLDAWLDRSPNVRLAFPQVLGLRDLTALLDAVVTRDIRSRTTLGLEAAAALAQVFVPTRAYSHALTTLSGHGFTVLTGPPEMGKTAIARMVALARFADGWEAFECRGPDDFFKTYDKDKPQVFVADDAFGSTEYRPELAASWAQDLDRLLRATDHRHWLCLTSRPGPLNEGLERLHLQDEAEHFPEPAQVQVDASSLTEQERALILYRHAKAAGLAPDAAGLVRAAARRIVASPHFTPLRIQRLVSQLKAIEVQSEDQQQRLLAVAVEEGLREPTRPMVTSFNALDHEHKQLLIAMLDAGARGVTLEKLDDRYAARFSGPATRSAADVASSIEEHFVRVTDEPRS
jgi:hypothetical protein